LWGGETRTGLNYDDYKEGGNKDLGTYVDGRQNCGWDKWKEVFEGAVFAVNS